MIRRMNRLRFKRDDPLRDLHVPKKDRLDNDDPRPWGDSNALDDETGDDTDFDREEVRNRGGIISPEKLQ